MKHPAKLSKINDITLGKFRPFFEKIDIIFFERESITN